MEVLKEMPIPLPPAEPRRTVHLRRYVAPIQLPTELCDTCSHADGCGWRKMNRGPVQFCEEFEVQAGEHWPPAPRDAAPPTDPPAQALVYAMPKGLCVNCDHRETCRLPRPESGVWHCQEYE